MEKIFDYSYDALVAWWSGIRAWRLSRADVVGDERFQRSIGAFYLSVAFVGATHYVVLRATGMAVGAEDWLLLQVGPAINFGLISTLLLILFRVLCGPYPTKHVVAAVLLMVSGFMCVTAVASAEQFSTGAQMFEARRDPSVSYMTAAIPELWTTGATLGLRIRLIVEVLLQFAAVAFYLVVWLPRLAVLIMRPIPRVRVRLTVAVLLALGVQLMIFESITNQIEWKMVAAVID